MRIHCRVRAVPSSVRSFSSPLSLLSPCPLAGADPSQHLAALGSPLRCQNLPGRLLSHRLAKSGRPFSRAPRAWRRASCESPSPSSSLQRAGCAAPPRSRPRVHWSGRRPWVHWFGRPPERRSWHEQLHLADEEGAEMGVRRLSLAPKAGRQLQGSLQGPTEVEAAAAALARVASSPHPVAPVLHAQRLACRWPHAWSERRSPAPPADG